MEDGVGLLGSLAQKVGASEDAIKLLLSVLAGYPISLVHRKYLYGKAPTLQHIYFIATGLSLGWFNFGKDMVHPIAAISLTYAMLAVFGGGTVSLALSFVYNMAHLLIGYWVTATSDYDIKWTMPQCVLALRLIGLSFNMSDGKEPEEKLSAENKKVAIRELPPILEMFAFNLYPASFLIGPQLPLTRFRNFVNLTLREKNGADLPDSVRAGFLRGLLGLFYLGVYLLGSAFVTDEYVLSEEFNETTLWKRLVLLGLWGRVALYKYICCWLITEGACIVMGLTYNGKNAAGEDKWDGCSNVKISVFESATRMNHYIESFNINTNHWVAQYIYKRLKFLKNKVLSQLGVLLFLALWHGFHSGYYATFFFEFISILAEKEVISNIERCPKMKELCTSPAGNALAFVLLRIYTFTTMGYAMIAFILLKHHKYLHVYGAFYFSFHIFFLAIIFGMPLAQKFIFPPAKRKEKKGD